MSIYPNPSLSGIFKIKNAENKVYKVQVSDISGKIVFDKLVTDGIVNLSKQNKGVYFVKVSDNEASFVDKVVVE